MLEELGLGESSSPEDADVLVFNTCTIREKPDTRLAAHLGNAKMLKERDPERVIAVGGCYAEAQRERIFGQYPFVDVAFGPGLDLAPRRVARRGRDRRRAFELRDRGRTALRRRAADAPRAALPGLGAGLDGLQLEVRVLHRARRPRSRGQPPAGGDRRRGDAARSRGRQGAHAARPERQLVGPRPAARHRHRVRRAAPGLRRGRGDRADPLHEPAPEGLPGAGDRRDRGVRVRVRARAPAAAVRLDAHPQGDASHVLARALPRAGRAAAGRDPGPRARHGHHRRLPGRDRGRLSRDARSRRGGALRQRVHVRVLAATRHGGGVDGGRRSPTTSSASGSSGSSSSSSGSPASATRLASAASRRCWSRAPAAPTTRVCAGARDATRRSTSAATRLPASSSRSRSRARPPRRSAGDGRRSSPHEPAPRLDRGAAALRRCARPLPRVRAAGHLGGRRPEAA